MKIEDKINKMGIKIPEVTKPVASYVLLIELKSYLYIRTRLPYKWKVKYEGKVGSNVTEEEAYDAARIAAINLH